MNTSVSNTSCEPWPLQQTVLQLSAPGETADSKRWTLLTVPSWLGLVLFFERQAKAWGAHSSFPLCESTASTQLFTSQKVIPDQTPDMPQPWFGSSQSLKLLFVVQATCGQPHEWTRKAFNYGSYCPTDTVINISFSAKDYKIKLFGSYVLEEIFYHHT